MSPGNAAKRACQVRRIYSSSIHSSRTPVPLLTPHHERILGALAHRGVASSAELQQALGKSQATVSRLLAELSSQVIPLGKARAARYALPHSIRGLAAQQPVHWTDEDGQVRALGTLSFLAGGLVHIDSSFVKFQTAAALPWFLAPLRAQGFLGRLHAQRLLGSSPEAGTTGDPDRWSLETVLYAALHLADAPGAMHLGTPPAAVPELLPPLSGAAPTSTLFTQLDTRADDVARTLPAGSSAGGEQPKFLAVLHPGQHVLVKFSPPRGTPFGERWHDLLHAEHLASRVLADHGVPVANSHILRSARRTYLVSERFDRVGLRGRRHAIAIGDVHTAFVAGPYVNWAGTAAALARQGRLSARDAERAAALIAFGRLIDNSDMHAGNLSLGVTLEGLAKPRFSLAPVYDMLPMRWRPNPQLGGAPDYSPFELDAQSLASGAALPAKVFWQRLEALNEVSTALRHVAGQVIRLGFSAAP
jgi:hypothetical protein